MKTQEIFPRFQGKIFLQNEICQFGTFSGLEKFSPDIIFQKIISGENDFPPEKVPNCQISLWRKIFPRFQGKIFLQNEICQFGTFSGPKLFSPEIIFQKIFFKTKNYFWRE